MTFQAGTIQIESVLVMNKRKQGKKARQETRRKIIMTALHPVAEQGIDSVIMRRISAESGCVNTAAVHYHFKPV